MTPVVFVIFGATGDLTHRKLLPSLFSLFQNESLPEEFAVIGIGRRPYSDEAFRDEMKQTVREERMSNRRFSWNLFSSHLYYLQGLFEDDGLYTRVTDRLKEIDEKYGGCVLRLYYLATPPTQYELILTKIKEKHLARGCGEEIERNTRILIEKPFGRDLSTAKHLDELLGDSFSEDQIYRIDHYLAKETVQNILAFRFANGIFEPTWNNQFIDHVQITVSETLGMEGRGGSYDGVGALRDVVQNHMMQLLSCIAMEQPTSFDAAAIRASRVKVIESLKILSPEEIGNCTIRGQYIHGTVDGLVYPGFKEETGVDPKSATETYAAIKVCVDTPRFAGVPFYLRTGKRMAEKLTEISLHYKKPELCNGDVCFFDPRSVKRSVLAIRVEPDEMIALRLMVKEPGLSMGLTPAAMDFSYKRAFPQTISREAYEKVLLDAIAGDQTLFASTQEVAASWKFITPILESWQQGTPSLTQYQPGTMGPGKALSLLEDDSRYWYLHGK